MFAPRRAARIAFLSAVFFASSALAERTLWLVRPLYPGQETLVERTEKALDKLIPAANRANEIIGLKELAANLKGKTVAELPCLTADSRCADPIDPFVAALGFDRVVLVQGGQDEAGFKFRVVSYRPSTKEVAPATASNAILEKALLGAVAKVVPVASSLQVTSTPSGATVYIDDVKVGVTPVSTQVLPGERVIRIDLKLHQPIEETLVIPVRGAASLNKVLEKVAARIVITASPAGAQIQVDGQILGRDKVDRGILPGQHTIRLSAEGHKDFEQAITVKADEQYQLDKTLEPIPGAADPNRVTIQNGTVKPPPPGPPPEPPTDTELTYSRGAYFHASFEWAKYESNRLVGRRFGDNGLGRTSIITTPGRTLIGASGEYGTFGRYFGLAVVGVTYLTNSDPMGLNVGYAKDTQPEKKDGVVLPDHIEPVHINLVTVRALQPQLRLCAWKFQFGVQAGFEFRIGQISESNSPPLYKDGFLVLDLLLSARLNVRFLIYEGLFVHGSFNYTWFLTGESAVDPNQEVRSSGSLGANIGLGYGF